MLSSPSSVVALLLFAALTSAFDIYNGQIYPPGLVIIDSPQPGTPEGGDILQVALDISGDGKLSLPPYTSGDETRFNNITIYLYSYDTGKNLTITNGTATANNASLGNILLQEPGSTVKHVDWLWPSCLVGNGQTSNSDRGNYNISIHQNFLLNGRGYYTIFDLPISVTNSIEANSSRPSCDELDNTLLSPEQENVAGTDAGVPAVFAPNSTTTVETGGSSSSSGSGSASTKSSKAAMGSVASVAGMCLCAVSMVVAPFCL